MVYDDLSAPPLELVRQYNRSVGGVHEDAAGDDGRAYGGVVRARKGKLVEDMTTDIVRLAWQAAGGSFDRPIHQQEYFKELTVPSLKHAISRFSNLLASFV